MPYIGNAVNRGIFETTPAIKDLTEMVQIQLLH